MILYIKIRFIFSILYNLKQKSLGAKVLVLYKNFDYFIVFEE